MAQSGEERFAEFPHVSRLILRDYPLSLGREDYGGDLVLTRREHWREVRAARAQDATCG